MKSSKGEQVAGDDLEPIVRGLRPVGLGKDSDGSVGALEQGQT